MVSPPTAFWAAAINSAVVVTAYVVIAFPRSFWSEATGRTRKIRLRKTLKAKRILAVEMPFLPNRRRRGRPFWDRDGFHLAAPVQPRYVESRSTRATARN